MILCHLHAPGLASRQPDPDCWQGGLEKPAAAQIRPSLPGRLLRIAGAGMALDWGV